MSALHQLIKSLNESNVVELTRAVGDLLQSSPDLSAIRDEKLRLPLHLCCGKLHSIGIANLLLNEFRGARKCRDIDGYYPIHFAAEIGNGEISQILISLDESCGSWQATNGRTPVHFAAQEGNFHILNLLINNNSQAVMIASLDGRLPLHLAAFNGSLECCQLLIEIHPHGILFATTDGHLPLHVAAEFNHAAVCKILLQDHMQTIFGVNSWGEIPLNKAINNNSQTVTRLFLDELPLSHQELLQQVRHRDAQAMGMLHFVCSHGDMQITERILELAPETARYQDNGGYLPIHMAAQCGRLEIFRRLLREVPGSERALSLSNRTALHFAAQGGHSEIVALLMRLWPQGADVIALEGNVAPLHLACYLGHHGSCEQLLRYALGDRDKEEEEEEVQTLSHCALSTKKHGDWLPLHSLFYGMEYLNIDILRLLLRGAARHCPRTVWVRSSLRGGETALAALVRRVLEADSNDNDNQNDSAVEQALAGHALINTSGMTDEAMLQILVSLLCNNDSNLHHHHDAKLPFRKSQQNVITDMLRLLIRVMISAYDTAIGSSDCGLLILKTVLFDLNWSQRRLAVQVVSHQLNNHDRRMTGKPLSNDVWTNIVEYI